MLDDGRRALSAIVDYGEILLAERGLWVIKGRGHKKGPGVPRRFDPGSLKPISCFPEAPEGYGWVISGTEMQRLAVEEFNAPYGRKLLWWLLNHQEQIPEEWKQEPFIAFAGDYDLEYYHDGRDGGRRYVLDGTPHVLELHYGQGGWDWGSICLCHDLYQCQGGCVLTPRGSA